MRIAIGSKNKAKVTAVEELLQEYPHLKDAVVEAFEVASDISDQPKSLEETIRGAINRAKNAYDGHDYSIGIESGLMEVPYSRSGYMDICVAAVYDGTDSYFGISSGWEFTDPEITRLMMKDGLNMSEAVNKVGMTIDPNIGSGQGAIGIVTKGRVDRKKYTQQALTMAFIHIDP